MKEISLNILDVAKNSIRANATNVTVSLFTDSDGWLTLTIKDNGCGMSEDVLAHVTDPFYTTRTTRKVGLGLPLLKMATEQTGGHLELTSSTKDADHGTTLSAVFNTKSIDCMPMGDIVSTVCILIAGSPDIDIEFSDISDTHSVSLNTAQLREVLGGISLAEPEVQVWIKEYLEEQYSENKN